MAKEFCIIGAHALQTSDNRFEAPYSKLLLQVLIMFTV